MGQNFEKFIFCFRLSKCNILWFFHLFIKSIQENDASTYKNLTNDHDIEIISSIGSTWKEDCGAIDKLIGSLSMIIF